MSATGLPECWACLGLLLAVGFLFLGALLLCPAAPPTAGGSGGAFAGPVGCSMAWALAADPWVGARAMARHGFGRGEEELLLLLLLIEVVVSLALALALWRAGAEAEAEAVTESLWRAKKARSAPASTPPGRS